MWITSPTTIQPQQTSYTVMIVIRTRLFPVDISRLTSFLDYWIFRGVQLFFLWSTIENCWSTKPKAWSRRLHWGAKRRKGEGGGGGYPSHRWGSGGPPPWNFWKIATKWCILVHFGAFNSNFKTENFYEKNCISLHKDFILDTKTFRFFSNLLLYLDSKCCTIQWPEYWSL